MGLYVIVCDIGLNLCKDSSNAIAVALFIYTHSLIDKILRVSYHSPNKYMNSQFMHQVFTPHLKSTPTFTAGDSSHIPILIAGYGQQR